MQGVGLRVCDQVGTAVALVLTMLYTLAIILLLLWLLGFVSAYTMSGFIHILLVVAIVLVLVRVISGRAPV